MSGFYKLMHDVEYQKQELEKAEQLLKEYKQRDLENSTRDTSKKVYKMYVIKENLFKMQVSCKKCSDKGYIDKTCHACGGKGIHNKGFWSYIIKEKVVEVVKIDRDENSEIRYWTDMSCFYEEKSKLIHFDKKDAKVECDKRNIERYGVEFFRQYLK